MKWRPTRISENLLIGSTLVEGSTLTEEESKQVLAGRTIQGHPISEIREITNYRMALEWLIGEVDRDPHLSIDLILGFHARLMAGIGEGGAWKQGRNYTYLSSGDRLDFASPDEVPRAVHRWVQRFNEKVSQQGELISLGSRLYFDFQMIHPFDDGNGRVGRVLMAYWFYWKGKLELSFYLKDKTAHLDALESANRGQLGPLESFFKKRTRKGK